MAEVNLIENDGSVKIETANGITYLHPVFCEITGKHICWRTHVNKPEYTPAYVSFNVVDPDGYSSDKNILILRTIDTF